MPFAAIAQPVERILGKDEVASSNLASSSKASEIFWFQRFSFYPTQELVTSSAELPMAILNIVGMGGIFVYVVGFSQIYAIIIFDFLQSRKDGGFDG